jgi:hypothetical protein
MHNYRVRTPSHLSASARRITDEPGFITMKIGLPGNLPGRTPGLLAFFYDDGEKQTVIRIMMFDNLAQGFLDNRPFAGCANHISFLSFTDLGGFENRITELANRLNLYTELTRKYQDQQKPE